MIARLAIPGGWMWSAWQPDRGMAFNSYLFERDGAFVAIDPLPLDENDVEWISTRGGIRTIVITNRDHERAAARLRERFDVRTVDNPADGEELFAGAYAVHIPYGKAPEFAIHLPDSRAAIVGDALIGAPAGALGLLPDEKLGDPRNLLLALRRLWGLQLQSLLLCDGAPIFGDADRILGELLESRGGAEVNRINLDELAFKKYKEHARFGCDDAEVGLLIGARKIGYRVAKLPPGKSFCPLHSHESEEEFFYVLEGNPSIRTLRGTIPCRAGDFIAFPTGERGTHELRNDSPQPCTVLLVGQTEAVEICKYPDSKKVLFDSYDTGRLMVRSVPQLEYFDGE
jgi:uncharacterized cupin superfamily protein